MLERRRGTRTLALASAGLEPRGPHGLPPPEKNSLPSGSQTRSRPVSCIDYEYGVCTTVRTLWFYSPAFFPLDYPVLFKTCPGSARAHVAAALTPQRWSEVWLIELEHMDKSAVLPFYSDYDAFQCFTDPDHFCVIKARGLFTYFTL